MLKLTCLGIKKTDNGVLYQLCDPSGVEKTVTEKQLRYILDTEQAYCENLVTQYGSHTPILTSNKPLELLNIHITRTHLAGERLSSQEMYDYYLKQCKNLGVVPNAVYASDYYGYIRLKRCLVTHGEFVIPPFVDGCYSFAFEDAVDLRVINQSGITSTDWMFKNCKKLKRLDLSSFDARSVTCMRGMFEGCADLEYLDLRNFNTSSACDMSAMFLGCEKLRKLDLRSFNTSQVTDMSGMFEYCYSLTDLDVSTFDTRKVYSFIQMFNKCQSLERLDLSSFKIDAIIMGMFSDCKNLRVLDLSQVFIHPLDNMHTRAIFDNCPYYREFKLPDWLIMEVRANPPRMG